MADDINRLIRSRLGDAIEAIPFRVAGHEGVAYRAPARSERVSREDTTAYYEAQSEEQLVVDNDNELRERDVRYYLGDGGSRLYAIPGLPPLDVVEFARVGTHNADREDAWTEVRDLLLETACSVGFDVLFADQAGLSIRLAQPVDASTALAWDRKLLDRMEASPSWADSYTLMMDEACDLLPLPDADERGGGLVPAFIVAKRSLRLWWD